MKRIELRRSDGGTWEVLEIWSGNGVTYARREYSNEIDAREGYQAAVNKEKRARELEIRRKSWTTVDFYE